MTRFERLAPVEHFFPVGLVAHLCGFDEHAGVARLTVGPRGDVSALFIDRLVEELEQHGIGGVEHVFGKVVTGVDETGRQTAHHTVDHGLSLLAASLLKREQVDVKNVL